MHDDTSIDDEGFESERQFDGVIYPERIQALAVLVIHERHARRFIPVTRELILGRHAASSVRIDDDTVSRRHARIWPLASGWVGIEDLSSTCGVRVRGALRRKVVLRPDDEIRLGTVTMTLRYAGMKARSVFDMHEHDPLTGMLTGSPFLARLNELAAGTDGAGDPLSALSIEIDHFKQINDAHGHDLGDRVICAVAAAVLRENPHATACRRWGNGFWLALPHVDAAGAVEAAERTRRAIERLAFPFCPSLRVTASLGAATSLPGKGDPPGLLELADARRQEAKRAGRNRVCAAGAKGGAD